jgi:hypothetical protein
MTVREVEALKDGVWGDGGNLWLVVEGKARRWTFRYKSPTTGKRREMGIGSYQRVTLAKAREKARNARHLLDDAIDPIDHQKRGRGLYSGQGGGLDRPPCRPRLAQLAEAVRLPCDRR